MYYNALDLKMFVQHIFESLGMACKDSYIAADALIRANLEGIDSHGISRLVIYARRIKEGRIQALPELKFERKSDSVLVVDGDNGLGQVVAYHALQEGKRIAKEKGIAAIAIKNSNHFGTASYYCQSACDEGLASIAFTNSPPGIPPWGGKKAFFGTNPIAFGFPTGTDQPVIIDLSTSVVARGKIILAAKQGQSIPKGWAIDADGNHTEDPNEALKGAVLPIGGAKGYGVALAVEILSGILSGAAYGPYVNSIYEEGVEKANVGHFFILLDIAKFMPLESFTFVMEQFLKEIKEQPKANEVDEILYPGERRAREYQRRLKQGIAISKEVENELKLIGQEQQVKFPLSLDRISV